MKAKFFLFSLFTFICIMTLGQHITMELTFSAEHNGWDVQLDSIKVMNRSQGGDTVLYSPDTVLVLDYTVGIPEMNPETGNLQVFQNYPNPVMDRTTISLFVPEKDKVSLIVTDMLGRVILKSDRLLAKGYHSFRFTPAGGNLYFFIAQWRGNSSSIKILQVASGSNGVSSLDYIGSQASSPQLKAAQDIQSFDYNPGDELLYIGYGIGLQSGMLGVPESSEAYLFQFATNIPCPGTPTVTYGGQVYNTIQIFSQCWLKENLNVGTMIDSLDNMTDNGQVEKYCYRNSEDSCGIYGGIYQWNEMMQYITQEGTQGICPPGWHLPTDEEWKVLEGAVDSQYGIGDPEWDISHDYRGYNAGTNLKSTNGWYGEDNGTDLFGFSGLPAGMRYGTGSFFYLGTGGYWWSSTEDYESDAFYRILNNVNPEVYRFDFDKEYGYNVRCLQRSSSTTITGTAAFVAGMSGDLSDSKVSIYTSLNDWNYNQPFKYVYADGSGDAVTYLMTNIPPDKYYLDVWKDNDNNGMWTAGDYVGWYGSGGLGSPELTEFEITQGQTLILDIQMMIIGNGDKLAK
jgi:uncharacterized protein (TIGR02145 family)